MPSRKNPNTRSRDKPRTVAVLRSKSRNAQRLARNKVTKPTPRTSQAIRRAAPLSNKKARKVERKLGYARKRELEATGVVEMRDVEKEGKNMRDKKDDAVRNEATKMDVDGVA